MACLALIILFLQIYRAVFGSPLVISYSSAGTPTNLLVKGEEVFAAVGNSLVTFNCELTWLYTIKSPANISQVVRTGDDNIASRLFLCLVNGRCNMLHYFTTAFEDPWLLGSNVNTAAAITRADDYYYVASGGMHSEFKICQFRDFNSFLMEADCAAKRIRNHNFISREFLHSFSDDDFIYFVAVDHSHVMEDNGIKVMRMCHKNSSTLSGYVSEVALFEVKLDCGPLAVDVSLMSLFKTNETVILGVHDNTFGSRLCVLNITEFNRVVTQTYESCITGGYDFQLPWSLTSGIKPCTSFGTVS